MIAGSIWHATVRDQISVYNFMESSSSTPTSIAKTQYRKKRGSIDCQNPSESKIRNIKFALQTKIVMKKQIIYMVTSECQWV